MSTIRTITVGVVTARNLFPGLDGYGKFMFGRAKKLMKLRIVDNWNSLLA